VAVDGAVWVPATFDGTLVRVNAADGEVTDTLSYGATPVDADGYLDSAVVADGSIWAASDYRALVVRVDPDMREIVASIEVPPRPAALAAGGGYVWAAHFLRGEVTRVDPATNSTATFFVPDVHLVGVAYLDDKLWVLATRPARAFELDPSTGDVLRTFDLEPPFEVARRFIDAWWLTAGDDALWGTNPTHDAVTRIGADGTLTYVATGAGRPFCVAAGNGSAWIATDTALVRVQGGEVTGVAPMTPANVSGFAQCAYGEGAAWFVNYDRGELSRVEP
jgi:streptogramin lyase